MYKKGKHSLKIQAFIINESFIDIFLDSYKKAYANVFGKKLNVKVDFEGYFTNDFFYEVYNEEYSYNYGDVADFIICKISFLNIPDKNIDDFKKEFLSLLRKKCEFVWKFEDSRALEIRLNFFKEIYEIEMKLREVVSYIFFTNYFEVNGLLNKTEVKKVGRNIEENDLLERLENDFFYISFSNYKDLLNIKEACGEKDEHEIWRDEQIKNKYNNFVNSLKDNLNELTRFRNAIMHNREFSDSEYDNYIKNKDELLYKIKEFKENYWNGIYGDEYGLVRGKEYESLKDIQDFKKGKKYKLKNWDGSDAVFVGEEGCEVVFYDKELFEYFKIY